MNINHGAPSTKDEAASLDNALDAIRNTWEHEARETSSLTADDLMAEIERRESGGPAVIADEADQDHEAARRKCRRARRRYQLAALLDRSHAEPVFFFTFMCVLGTLGLFANQLMGVVSLTAATLVGLRAVYSAIRLRHTSFRLRLLFGPTMRPKGASIGKDDDGRFADTPIFEQCGRFISPGVLESLRANLEIMRAQHEWSRNYLDANTENHEENDVDAESDHSGLANNEVDEEAVSPRHCTYQDPEVEIFEAAHGSATRLNDGRHRRGPRPLPDQQQAC